MNPEVLIDFYSNSPKCLKAAIPINYLSLFVKALGCIPLMSGYAGEFVNVFAKASPEKAREVIPFVLSLCEKEKIYAFPSTPPIDRSELDWKLLERFLNGDDSYYETILHLRG